MAKPAGRFESCCGGLCSAKAFESCCEGFECFKACPKRATRQFRSPIETAFGANREAPWQSKRDASKAAAGGLCGSKACESCCEGFEGFKARPNPATWQFRSPIETACGANREAPWRSQQDASRAAAEGCAVLRPSKAAARALKVLRPAQNVPRGSFEAKASRTLIETSCVAPIGRHHGKASRTLESCCRGLCSAEAFESCCEGFEGFKACPKRATWQFRSPKETTCGANREACGANREAPWHSKDASKAAAEGEVRRPSKAAAKVLKRTLRELLRRVVRC